MSRYPRASHESASARPAAEQPRGRNESSSPHDGGGEPRPRGCEPQRARPDGPRRVGGCSAAMAVGTSRPGRLGQKCCSPRIASNAGISVTRRPAQSTAIARPGPNVLKNPSSATTERRAGAATVTPAASTVLAARRSRGAPLRAALTLRKPQPEPREKEDGVVREDAEQQHHEDGLDLARHRNFEAFARPTRRRGPRSDR